MSDPLSASAMSSIRPLRRPGVRDAAFDRRWKSSWNAELHLANANTSCVVVDVSVQGAGLSIAEAPTEGTVVALVVSEQKPIAARVVWRRTGATGLCFLERQPWILDLAAGSEAP